MQMYILIKITTKQQTMTRFVFINVPSDYAIYSRGMWLLWLPPQSTAITVSLLFFSDLPFGEKKYFIKTLFKHVIF